MDHLLDRGINPETMLAVTLIPLAIVAWADGSIEPKEREAIQRAAAEKGIAPGSVAEKVLNTWLTDPLDADLVTRGNDTFRRSGRRSPRTSVPRSARWDSTGRVRSPKRLAASWDGLGSRISAQEKAVLDDLAKLLAG